MFGLKLYPYLPKVYTSSLTCIGYINTGILQARVRIREADRTHRNTGYRYANILEVTKLLGDGTKFLKEQQNLSGRVWEACGKPYWQSDNSSSEYPRPRDG